MPVTQNRKKIKAVCTTAPKTAEPIVTLVERWDEQMVHQITALQNIEPEDHKRLRQLISSSEKGTICKGKLQISYSLKKDCSRKWGRLSSNGLQTLPRWMRRLISHQYYWDIDMVNCHYKILEQICEKQNISCPAVTNYIENREYWLAFGDRSDLKTLFLELANGVGLIKCPPLKPEFMKFWAELEAELESITKVFFHSPAFSEERLAAEQEKDDTTTVERKFFALTLQRQESIILMHMKDFFEKNKFKVGVLVFDGLMIEKNSRKLDKWLPKCEAYILNKTGLFVQLLEKTLQPEPDDWNRLDGPLDLTMMKPVERLSYLMTRQALANNFARTFDTMYQMHKTVKGVYLIQPGNAQDHINNFLQSDHVYKEGVYTTKLIDWWNKNDHKHFPILADVKCDHNLIAFDNGYFHIQDLHFYSYERYAQTFKKEPLTFFYHNATFNDELCQNGTPVWDEFLHYQWDNATVDFFEVCIGRMFYGIGKYDDWQIVPYLIGQAGTGKSTILKTVQKMFPDESVGIIAANNETTFGLEALIGKRLVLFPDAPRDIAKALPSTTFQSMASGEKLTIAKKGKTAIHPIWTAPMMAGSNFYFNYPDDGGRFSRRCMAFPMDKTVDQVNGLLAESICAELTTVLIRCIRKYREFAELHKGKGIWSIVPKLLLDKQEETKQQTNRLYKFLRQGDDYYEFQNVRGEFTLLKDFTAAYKNHCRYHLQEPYKCSDLDETKPFRDCNFEKTTIKCCNFCFRRAENNCCALFSRDKRTNRNAILNMRLVKLSNGCGDAKIVPEALTESEIKKFKVI